MDFIDKLKQFSSRLCEIKDSIQTEESTKMSMIVPFFQLLGYDVFNPSEFCPEYTADVGIKRGEKVDYAIIIDNNPAILIECKWCGEKLEKHSSQLFRYFSTSAAKFGILTNGLSYQFYTDLDESNKMDLSPFLEVDMLNLKETDVVELKKFCKSVFDTDYIFSTASELKYSKLIKEVIKRQLDDPTDDFIRFILSDIYQGQKNQKVLDKFKGIVKKSFNSFINETMNDKISSALKSGDAAKEEEAVTESTDPISKIITSDEEMQSFYIIRSIGMEVTNIDNITYRDTERYFGVLFQNNNRKPICRLNLDTKKKQLLIPDDNKNFTRYYFDSLGDLYNYKEAIIESIKHYI